MVTAVEAIETRGLNARWGRSRSRTRTRTQVWTGVRRIAVVLGVAAAAQAAAALETVVPQPMSMPPWSNPSTVTKENPNWITCDDDLGWRYGDTEQSSNYYKTPQLYLESPDGRNCKCPTDGRWRGHVTNGTWFWDYNLEDWNIDIGTEDSPTYVFGRQVLGATSEWRFFKEENSQRNLVSVSVTVWGQPTHGVDHVPDVYYGFFQSSAKFASLDPQQKVIRDSFGNIMYKGATVRIVYECQLLYTDTLSPDKRDGFSLKPYPSPPGQVAEAANAEPSLGDTTPSAGPQDSKWWPHKLAWYMFLTSTTRGSQPVCDQGTPQQSTGYSPGQSKCPQAGSAGSTGATAQNAPLCPTCIPAASYRGSDAGGSASYPPGRPENPKAPTPSDYIPTHGELYMLAGTPRASSSSQVPVCSSEGPVDSYDDTTENPFPNDFYSFCDYPLVTSSMALPINSFGGYKSFYPNGTIIASQPILDESAQGSYGRPGHSKPPGYPGYMEHDTDGIQGAANTLLLCDGVFDHCTLPSADQTPQPGESWCGYGHQTPYLQLLSDNEKRGTGMLGHVQPLGGVTIANLVCVRNPWVQGLGWSQQKKAGGQNPTYNDFKATCESSSTSDHTFWTSGGPVQSDCSESSSCTPTSNLKGGGWGWPYCPNNAPNPPIDMANTNPYCALQPQPTGEVFHYVNCLTMRMLPVIDDPPTTTIGFWIVGATLFLGFSVGWVLFFWSIRSKSEEKEEEEAPASQFVNETQAIMEETLRRIQCNRCGSQINQRPVPHHCPFCSASRTEFRQYDPPTGQWVQIS